MTSIEGAGQLALRSSVSRHSLEYFYDVQSKRRRWRIDQVVLRQGQELDPLVAVLSVARILLGQRLCEAVLLVLFFNDTPHLDTRYRYTGLQWLGIHRHFMCQQSLLLFGSYELSRNEACYFWERRCGTDWTEMIGAITRVIVLQVKKVP